MLWIGFSIIVMLLVVSVCTLRYSEDIFDFLPVDEEYKESMDIYTKITEANRVVFIFEGESPDSICDAIDACAQLLPNAITELDIDSYQERLAFIYQQMPYFLDEDDYARLDTLLTQENIEQAIKHNKETLMLPGSSFLYQSIAADPLHLIPMSEGAVGQYAGAQSAFTSYNGYLMTSDQKMGFAFYDSPYGGTETQRNSLLIDSLNQSLIRLSQMYPTINIRLLGAPVIAVGNAQRIKCDTIIVLVLSLVIITFLLLYAFPRKRDIFLILLSVGFGGLFGLAVLSIFEDTISAIVIGIGAILMGIAVNYPLHVLVHQRYTTSIRQTLQEVLKPLVIGNVSTIGAFLVLVPMQAPALRQLGIFASSMLLGTILFTICVLPHLMSNKPTQVRNIPLITLSTKASKVLYWVLIPSIVLLLTVPLLKEYNLFDSNLSHINYMTSQQREDFAYFESISPASDEQAFLVNSARAELMHRHQLWSNFWTKHNASQVAEWIRSSAKNNGFRETTFDAFILLITQPYPSLDLNDSNVLASVWPGKFDTTAMNARVTNALSSNFDYLSICCSVIVFLFLWMSFKNILLAIIAFIPMAVSMGLIIAIMQLFGLQFNIVNVILATFILGQGDDYTIFVLEGCLQEQKSEVALLPQYKQSILLSALIMLVGIGVLIFAKHPAMFSLGVVTLIGMTCVVSMAYFLPQLLVKATCKIPALKNYILK
jgi:predicted exporter